MKVEKYTSMKYNHMDWPLHTIEYLDEPEKKWFCQNANCPNIKRGYKGKPIEDDDLVFCSVECLRAVKSNNVIPLKEY